MNGIRDFLPLLVLSLFVGGKTVDFVLFAVEAHIQQAGFCGGLAIRDWGACLSQDATS